MLDMESFKKEAYETLKAKAEAKEKVTTKPKLRQMIDEDEVASHRLRTNDVANMKAKRQYDGTTGEGVEQVTLLSGERTTAKDKVDDLRVANTTSRTEEGFGIQVSETSNEKGVSIIDACMADLIE